MSQLDTYSQVQSVSAVRIPSYAETVAPIVKSLLQSAPVQVRNDNLVLQVQSSKQSVTSSPLMLQSPEMLRPVIQEQFNNNIDILNKQPSVQSNSIVKIKTAGLMTIQQANLQVENRAVVVQSIQNLMNATTLQQAKDSLTSMFSTIKEQHTKVFTNTVANTIQTASIKIGFNQVKLETITSNLTRIVATNPKGINLISEIRTDEKKKINIVSELEGITDSSCKATMDAFNKELETMGIVAERKDRKPTGGIPVLEFTNKLKKERKKPKRTKIVDPNEPFIDHKSVVIHQHINNQ
jgi:hypothetical protein